MASDLHALAVNALNRRHIRKGRKVAILIANMETAIPTAITEVAGSGAPPTLKTLTGFRGLGLLSKSDGVSQSRDREKQTVMAIGFQDSVRSDVSSDVFQMQCVGLETNKVTIEQFLQVDLTDYPIDPTTGELSFPQPTEGDVPQNRILSIAQDRNTYGVFWWGRLFTAGVVEETDDQSLGSDEDPYGWPITFSSEVDTDAGYSVRHFFGGPGWKAALDSMGFDAA